MEGIGNVVKVARVEASNRDAAVHGHVHCVLLSEFVDLVLVEASVSEHANLIGNVRPVVLVSKSFKLGNQTRSHLCHTSRHVSEVLVPHGCELWVTQNDVDDSSAVDGWVGVNWSGDLLDAGHDNLLLSFASTDDGESSSSLTIKTEVLCERLEKDDVVGVLLEEAERVGITFEVTRCEALVCAVKSTEEVLGLDDIKDVLPLGISWVNTSWVVGTHMEHHERVVLGSLDVSHHAIVVESLCLWVEVSVLLELISCDSGKSTMDGPCGGWHKEVDILVLIPVREESKSKTERSSSRDGLGSSNSVLLQRLGVWTESQQLGLCYIRVNTLDASILVVHIFLKNDLFSSSHAVQDEWLALVVTISTHAKKDFLWVRITLESFIKPKNWVCWSSSQVRPGAKRSCALVDELSVSTGDKLGKHLEFNILFLMPQI